ncbi:uncharacterized protein LOC121255004 [Juglans microcarpa x Juglans regia]|uniref:uncharacterized protein LOC121255004 n=1 Tax=Juglans microcarpa x Juglans regia TaxID=2249226 RepID=UPI001B7ECCD0|nr:uncharacterized protein LOC121255004 [Juglans microcarpa x Juglans regia]
MEETRVNYIDFIHEHPLVFKEDLENDGNKEAVCSRCQEPVLGSGYKFSECNFLLHKSCNEPPLEIHHPLHQNHTLILCAPSTYVACDGCYENCSIRLFYSCKQCKFDIDIRCVSRWRNSIDECHRHDFVPILKQIQFTCDACGEETKDVAYLCSLCRFLVHGKCTRYPRTISTTVHNHSLTLTCSLHQMVEEKDDIFCKLCHRKVKTKYGVYYCQDCSYAAHLQCAQKYEGEWMDPTTESVPCESDLVSEIKHFSHEHKLIISKKELEDDKICEGCMLSISPPFYSCEQCNFFLHRSCTKLLPKKQQSLFHGHPLTLLSQAPSPSGIFRCFACSRFQHGFCYKCDLCKYKVDIQCASLPETLKHEGHQHSLFIGLNRDRIVCNGCYDEYRPSHLFVCKKCETFGLCFRCATLPYRVRYEYDLHDYLTLTYSVEDDSGEYYCFICEESRDSRKWFYYCKECDFAAHPDCVIGKYSRIKFGRTFTCRQHEHPVTIVQKNEYSAPCDTCGTTFHGLAVACTQCKFNSHLFVQWWLPEGICAPRKIITL